MNEEDKNRLKALAAGAAKASAQPSEETPKKEEPVSMKAEDYGELTEDEKEAIRAEARAKVALELKEAKKKDFMKKTLTEFRKQAKPGQEIVTFQLDLPGHADTIKLDGTVYFHGVTYNVPRDVYNTMADIQARAWEHENEIGGANRDLYKGRAPMLPLVSAQGVIPNTNDPSRIAPMVKF